MSNEIALLSVVLAAQLAAIAMGVLLYQKLRDRTTQAVANDEEIMEVLKLIKGWALSAKSHQSDAKETLKEVKESIKKPSSDEVLLTEVKKVPDATAERVVEKIAESGGHPTVGK